MLKNRVSRVADRVEIRNVIMSLSDKEGVEEFARGLERHCPELHVYSTGGTYRKLLTLLTDRKRLTELSEYTGQPEMQGGLVKSLDFHVHAGILAEPDNEEHRSYLEEIGAVYFDMVVVNLYPFGDVIADPHHDLEDARGNIDIGGPTMLRAAAKNFPRVAAVTEPVEYEAILRELVDHSGTLSLETRYRLARQAFEHTSSYEATIAAYFSSREPTTLAEVYKTAGAQPDE